MAEIKAHEVDRWLAGRAPRPPILLVYGPDRGAVSERAKQLAVESGVSLDDPFAVTRLEASEIDKDAGRLIDEASTFAMFSGRRLIWIKGAGAQKGLAEAVKVIAASPPPDLTIVIEGGDIKKGTGVRGVAEASRLCMALPCYADGDQSIDALVVATLAKAGLSIDDQALALFRANLGGDRMATRSEIEKLALYAAGRNSVSLEDVRASMGDVSALSADEVVDSVLSGKQDEFDSMFARLTASGGQAGQLLGGALRQLQAILTLRIAMEAENRSASAAVAAARPPIYFGRRRLVEHALTSLSARRMAEMADNLARAIHLSRTSPSLAYPFAHQALIEATRAFSTR